MMVIKIPVKEREKVPAIRLTYRTVHIPFPSILKQVLEELGYPLITGFKDDGDWFLISAEKPDGKLILAFYYSLKPNYLNPQTWAIVTIGNSRGVLEKALMQRIKPIEVKKSGTGFPVYIFSWDGREVRNAGSYPEQ
jgi:hypothetical protein